MDMIIGGPGTGKTTELVSMIKFRKPNSFAMLSFTRQAAAEAKAKLSVHYSQKDLIWVRTIHSMAFQLLRLNKNSIFTYQDQLDFGNLYGYEFSAKFKFEEDGTFEGLTEEDIIFRKMVMLKGPEDDDFLRIDEMGKKYVAYKKLKGLLDFNDLLGICIQKGVFPKLDMLVVDEVQDLSGLQLHFIDNLAHGCKEVILAGDDDQMIYEWAGVKREHFMELSKICEKRILSINYRLPGEIVNKSNSIIKRCRNRIEKPTPVITQHMFPAIKRIDDMGSDIKFEPTMSYLVLVRNAYLLKGVKELLEELVIKYGLLKSDNYGKKVANVQLSTIHGSKGAEADVVIILKDVSPATYEHITSDAEHRVWYVGVTRAKKQLILVESQGPYSYDL